MRLTAYTDYALRVLMHVAMSKSELVRVSEIAGAFGISHNHLTKVVHHLGSRGFLSTQQGRNGGIRLARSTDQITVGQVVREFEPDFRLVECFDPDTSGCRIQRACVLKGAFGDALDLFLGRLDQTTIAELVNPRKKLQSLLKFPTVNAAARA